MSLSEKIYAELLEQSKKNPVKVIICASSNLVAKYAVYLPKGRAPVGYTNDKSSIQYDRHGIRREDISIVDF